MIASRILLVGNYAPDRQFSMLAYGSMLHKGLLDRGVQVHLIKPAQILGRLPFCRKWFGYIDKFILFIPRLLWSVRKADLVHVCDQGNAMYMKWLGAKCHLLTCHDLFSVRSAWGEIQENTVRFTGRFFQRLILAGIRRAQHIVSVSPATTAELIEKAGISPNRIMTINNGLNYPYHAMETREATTCVETLGLAQDKPYLLHVGTPSFYKNHSGLLRIFASLRANNPDLQLVMVGARLDEKLTELVKELDLGQHLAILAEVSSELLCALYSRAEALIFPSLMEGFGYPVIEAQACGCPVFASDREPIPYVGGKAAVYFNPEKPEEAAKTIQDNWEQREQMRTAGLANVAARFSTEKMISGYHSLYMSLLQKVVQ